MPPTDSPKPLTLSEAMNIAHNVAYNLPYPLTTLQAALITIALHTKQAWAYYESDDQDDLDTPPSILPIFLAETEAEIQAIADDQAGNSYHTLILPIYLLENHNG